MIDGDSALAERLADELADALGDQGRPPPAFDSVEEALERAATSRGLGAVFFCTPLTLSRGRLARGRL